MSERVLVTGGTGFVGMHIILQLLEKGYQVRTTVRSLDRKDRVIEAMASGGITDFDRLSFAQADISMDDHGMRRWKAAIMS